VDEPKSKIEKLWTYRGIYCLAIAVPVGHRCGYIRIPEDHEWIGILDTEALERMEGYANSEKDYMAQWYADPEKRRRLARQEAWADKITVHGGITFGKEETPASWEESTEGGDGIPGGYWIGFDCAHAWDARDPAIQTMFGSPNEAMSDLFKLMERLAVLNVPDATIRTLDYVIGECQSMVDQLLAAKVLDQAAEIVNSSSL
jgi:hypothetical protein